MNKTTEQDAFWARLQTHLGRGAIEEVARIRVGADDDRIYFVGPDWNKVKVIGSKRAAKISYEQGCTAIDREGMIFCALMTSGIPSLVRKHK